MLPGLELMACQGMAVPTEVMQHVVGVESSFNPYAIGVVGGRLARQPANLAEALATVRMLEAHGRNFSVGLAQVNRGNLATYGLQPYERAFDPCANVVAGSRILAECHARSGGHWGKAFSCYYSGNFQTGFRHGYVEKVFASMSAAPSSNVPAPIPLSEVGAASGGTGQEGSPRQALSRPLSAPASVGIVARRMSVNPAAVPDQVAADAGGLPVAGSAPALPPQGDVAFVF